jgi:hypothetical protein
MPVLQQRGTENVRYEFHVGDRVEDKKTHKRGRVTFVYSELERKGEVIEVLFDGHDESSLAARGRTQRPLPALRDRQPVPRGKS